jgi:hypothetical protein
MRLDRSKIEGIMDAAQLRLELRERVWAALAEPYELFIAAGESKPPHLRYQRFGIDPTDFPLGCYVTFAWVLKGEDQLVLGIPAFYEKNHNPELTDEGKKQARINRCKEDAMEFFRKRDRARRKGFH